MKSDKCKELKNLPLIFPSSYTVQNLLDLDAILSSENKKNIFDKLGFDNSFFLKIQRMFRFDIQMRKTNVCYAVLTIFAP